MKLHETILASIFFYFFLAKTTKKKRRTENTELERLQMRIAQINSCVSAGLLTAEEASAAKIQLMGTL